MPKAAIQAEQLVREFKKGPRAVDGIDLEVSPGETARSIPSTARGPFLNSRTSCSAWIAASGIGVP